MRIAVQILAILAIFALLAPDLRWARPTAATDAAETCSCPPNACRCPGHRHVNGHHDCCAMADGGCGVHAPDTYFISTLAMMIYMPAAHVWRAPAMPSAFDSASARLALLPSHGRIPDQPPRANA